jgi:hypothetical protein
MSQLFGVQIKDYFNSSTNTDNNGSSSRSSSCSGQLTKFYYHTVSCIYDLCIMQQQVEMNVDFTVDMLTFIDKNFDVVPQFLDAFCQFFNESTATDGATKFLDFVLALSNVRTTTTTDCRQLKPLLLTIVNKLFEKSFDDSSQKKKTHDHGHHQLSLLSMMGQINRLTTGNQQQLIALILNNEHGLTVIVQEFIKNLVKSKAIDESCTLFILNALIKLTGEYMF